MRSLRPAERIAAGPAAVIQLDKDRRLHARQEDWPYVHVYPPPNSVRRNPNNYIAAPAVAAQAVILEYQVPSGNWFYMDQLGLFYVGQTFAFGDFLFSVDVDKPLGSTALQQVPLNDLQNVGFPMGSFEHGPWKLSRAQVFAPGNTIRAKVTNVNVGEGSPNTFGAVFSGYLLVVNEDPLAR